MTKVLVDGDIVCFRCAASAENEPVEVAQIRVNELMYRIVQETEATSYQAFIGGTDNFRKQIYPAYKANRKDKPLPKHLDACREQLVVEWKAVIVNGMETDDALGIHQSSGAGETVIASIDKDLLMIPGRHYNFVKQEFYTITELDGIRHFWFQMIMGDRSDNIPGYDGTARQKVPKFLQPKIDHLLSLDDEGMMGHFVYEMYQDAGMSAQYEINKQLLWILREPKEGTIYERYEYYNPERGDLD